MSATILHTSASKWDESVARLDGGVYFTAGYHSAYEGSAARAEAFVFEKDSDILFYPYLKRPIERVANERVVPSLYDIETVYGYTGPLASTDDRSFVDQGWEEFSSYCRASGIVAEFTRFNPFRKNWTIASNRMSVTLDRQTVVMDLPLGEDALWTGYSASQRNMIRKATRRGLMATRLPLPDGLETFLPLYEATMRRLDAANIHFHPPGYYERLVKSLGDAVACIGVFDGQNAVAAGLFFLDPSIIHYHLSGSDYEAQAFGPNNLLLHSAALEGIRSGRRWLHLGGGRSNAPDDSLLLFKQSFSKRRLDFMIGRAVHDQNNYLMLCDRWKKANFVRQPQSYFLQYRL